VTLPSLSICRWYSKSVFIRRLTFFRMFQSCIVDDIKIAYSSNGRKLSVTSCAVTTTFGVHYSINSYWPHRTPMLLWTTSPTTLLRLTALIINNNHTLPRSARPRHCVRVWFLYHSFAEIQEHLLYAFVKLRWCVEMFRSYWGRIAVEITSSFCRIK